MKSDERVEHILEQILKFTDSDFRVRGTVSEKGDETDAIIAGLNTLGEELEIKNNRIKEKEKRIDSILSILLKYTTMDFSETAKMSGQGDEIDAIAAGLNVLREEFLDRITFIKKNEARIGSLLETLLRYTTMDFSEAAELSEHGDEIDAIAAGLNSLREELIFLSEKQKKSAAELEHQMAQLDIANKELEAFSYSVSHDLRTPLRAIHGFTNILAKDYAGKLDEEGKQMMNTVMNNAKKMGQLIDELLTFSRIGKKELQRSKVDMKQMAESVLAELKHINPDFKGEVIVHPMPPAIADPGLLSQVFVNLLSNALKYSGKKEKPVIEVGSLKKENEVIYFIKDNGVGFDMKYYNKLFGVFQRLHRMEEFEGNGVGLALIKRIITRHGGNVWAEAEINKGATFYFTLDNP